MGPVMDLAIARAGYYLGFPSCHYLSVFIWACADEFFYHIT